MRALRVVLLLVVAIGLSGCGSKFKSYNGPEVTQIYVNKTARRMYLLHDRTVLESYDIDLSGAASGHKQFEGDGKTPEGLYYVDRRNPDSNYHLSLGISYPNEQDVEVARAAGLPPGGDIFIHGRGDKDRRARDWTVGCIAVKDREIEDIYAMVRDGTPIFISP